MKILLLHAYQLFNSSGGLAKVISKVANYYVRKGYDVTVTHYDDRKGVFVYPCSRKVKFVNLYTKKSYLRSIKDFFVNFHVLARKKHQKQNQAILKRKEKSLKQLVNDTHFDIIIAFQPEILPFIRNVKIPIILSLHTVPSIIMEKYTDKEKEVFNYPDVITVLLPIFINDIKKVSDKLCIDIPNGISIDGMKTRNCTSKKIIYLARLSSRKQQDLLIKAFSKIVKYVPEWTIELWGQTDINNKYENYLRKLIINSNLQDKIYLKGFSCSPLKELETAQLCVFPSKYEGFGLSLLEGMSIGLPTIGFIDSPGVNYLIRNSYNGLLCGSTIDDLANCLLTLIQDENLQEKLSKQAKNFAKQYRDENVLEQWDLLLNIAKKEFNENQRNRK